MIYISVFFISTFFIYLGEYYKKFKKKYTSAIFFAIGILIVAVLAGVRDLNVGTDIATYGEWLFRGAKRQNNFLNYQKIYKEIDILFLMMTYIMSKMFSDSHWLYFVIALLQYCFTFWGITYYRNKVSVTFSWFIFLLLFYGDTLNAMRQFIAIAISFWAFQYGIKKEYKKYLFFMLIAVLFHNTAIISLGIYIIYLLIEKGNTMAAKAAVILGALLLAMFYSYVLEFLVNIGVLNARFEHYLYGEIGFQLNPIFIRAPFIVAILLWYYRFKYHQDLKIKALKKNEADFLVIILILELLTAEMRAVIPALYRVSFYFGYYKIIAYSRLVSVSSKKNKRILKSGLIIFLIILWIYQNVYQGNNEIYPYTSKILGIY